MAIKKRSFKTVTPEEAGIDASFIGAVVAHEREAAAAQAPDIDPYLDIEALRLDAYIAGNRGEQRHPKDEDVAKLLAGVQHVQNTDEFARIESFYRSRIRSPLTAIRAFMVLAEGGPKKANDDTGTANPLWAFRNGTNPFYGKFKNENEEADDDD